MAQVFVSYSSREADQANELVKKLEQAGIRCWIAPRDIPMGSDYTDEIPEAIEACPAFLLLLSPNSQNSKWVKMELTQALNDNRYILPLQMEDFIPKKGFTFLLQNAQIRPYYSNPQGTLDEAIQKIRQFAPQPAAPKPATTVQPDPEPKENSLSAEACYQKGYAFLVEKKYSDGVKWLRMAADMGHCDAQYKLGVCYHFGNGVPRDKKESFVWIRKAAAQGSAVAQYLMGLMYQKGRGVPQDLTEARKWYEKSAAQGRQDAINRLKKL